MTRGANWSQCSMCDAYFTSDSAFDAHLPSPLVDPQQCRNPATVKGKGGRLLFDVARGAWHWEGERPARAFASATATAVHSTPKAQETA